jgi:hypothetical protein
MAAAIARMAAAAVVMGFVLYGVWWAVDDALGRALWAQVVSVGSSCVAGAAVYGAIVWALGVPEARQILEIFGGRLRRGRA